MAGTLKVVSWNVNSIRVRIDHLRKLLSEEQPDIVLLQETKVIDENFPIEEFEHGVYNAIFYGQKTYNGVAILSKGCIENISRGLPGQQEARFLACHTCGIEVASVYVPNGVEVGHPQYYHKLKFFDDLLFWCSNKKSDKCVVGGDFNITYDDSDLYNPQSMKGQNTCTSDERIRLRSLVTDYEYIDSYQTMNTDEGRTKYTWWDYRHCAFKRDHGMRIDYIFASKLCSKDMIGADILKSYRGIERPSDHAPIILEMMRV